MTGRRTRVAVVFGGRSGEHEVSLDSAASVMAAIDKAKYEVVPIGISKTGRWIVDQDPMARLRAAVGAGGDSHGSEDPRSTAPAAGAANELIPGLSGSRMPAVDVVFPVLHGTFGEDGTIQGLFEMADLPYVGAGVLGSALGMDKIAQKEVVGRHGIPVVDFVTVLRREFRSDPKRVIRDIESRLPYPVFVKPANLGSSVGISKAASRQRLAEGLAKAAIFDRRIIVEQGVVNAREIECAVLGNDDPAASVPGEVVPCNEFYDYDAKYRSGGRSDLIIPAVFATPGMADRVRDLAVKAFKAIDCAGMARVDFLLERDTERLYVNELNTIPGFTSISMYPKLWEASGIPYPALIDRLISLALERHADKDASRTSYGG